MCSIDWCAFTWQAFATLCTGAAATGGAVFIGSRQLLINREQVRVAQGQARIASTQASTARMAQRAALFDRRYAVYTAIQDYLRRSMSSASIEASATSSEDLHIALDKAKFLFPDAVRDSILEALNAADDYAEITEDMRDSGPLLSRTDPRRKARLEKRKAVLSRLRTLADIMGEEMRLYSDGTVSE